MFNVKQSFLNQLATILTIVGVALSGVLYLNHAFHDLETQIADLSHAVDTNRYLIGVASDKISVLSDDVDRLIANHRHTVDGNILNLTGEQGE